MERREVNGTMLVLTFRVAEVPLRGLRPSGGRGRPPGGLEGRAPCAGLPRRAPPVSGRGGPGGRPGALDGQCRVRGSPRHEDHPGRRRGPRRGRARLPRADRRAGRRRPGRRRVEAGRRRPGDRGGALSRGRLRDRRRLDPARRTGEDPLGDGDHDDGAGRRGGRHERDAPWRGRAAPGRSDRPRPLVGRRRPDRPGGSTPG